MLPGWAESFDPAMPQSRQRSEGLSRVGVQPGGLIRTFWAPSSWYVRTVDTHQGVPLSDPAGETHVVPAITEIISSAAKLEDYETESFMLWSQCK